MATSCTEFTNLVSATWEDPAILEHIRWEFYKGVFGWLSECIEFKFRLLEAPYIQLNNCTKVVLRR